MAKECWSLVSEPYLQPSALTPAGGCRKQLECVMRRGTGKLNVGFLGEKRKLTSHSEMSKAWLTGQLGICSVAYSMTQRLHFSMGEEK